ncbi:hypothetical protein M441DRAFT_53439 [Trichoderma asperellum CBS 433.97]|uniref:Uncharacterized protein n=1 Tax=Trichoderma asperellum (strain ATCC 204424 / CBS 433.97 / NBRC 101777) TaxID=1042311 RepID=A0A2T3ZPK8_TRIA4|nr:hypothetical protein M441DRAFT_53439 [Trichoderma asperellum CBS 433.97]PTB46735.1 hypothetical protein M441DRAFT_53439 [Trichoderma asperellum CBS 433.97]
MALVSRPGFLGRVKLSVAQRCRGSGRPNATAAEQMLSKSLGGMSLCATAAKSHNSNHPPAGRQINDQPKGAAMSRRGPGSRIRQWFAPATLPYIVRIGSRVVNPAYHASKSPGVFQRYYLDSSFGLPLPWLRTVQAYRYTCGCVRIASLMDLESEK